MAISKGSINTKCILIEPICFIRLKNTVCIVDKHFSRTKTFEGCYLKKNIMLSYHQIIVLAALLCVGLAAGNSISLTVHESGQLPSGISVRIDSIQDSRCPAKVQCIWAGRVEVKVLLSQFRNSESVCLVLQS